MENPEDTKTVHPYIERYIFGLAILWTVTVAAGLAWNITNEKKNTIKVAQIQARIAYEKDVIYRRWNTLHGGVYVPITEETQPNQYMSDIPERDITTSSDKHLTLMNPDYMMRQVYDLSIEEFGVIGHITSLNPTHEGNAPDHWEKEALKAFEAGKTEFSAIELIWGKQHMRLMRPIFTEEGCMQCHANQVYNIGDIRGGLSVAVPMEPLLAIERLKIVKLLLGYILLWIIGLTGIIIVGKRLIGSDRERKKMEKDLHIMSITDHLTGLLNRRGFYTMAQKQCEIASRANFNLAFLFLDINGMKEINDKFGHKTGDTALVDTAKILKKSFRSADITARIGGDEFVVMMIETPDTSIKALTARLKENLHVYNAKENKPYELSLSSGLKEFSHEHPCSLDDLISSADKLMYEQKKKDQREF